MRSFLEKIRYRLPLILIIVIFIFVSGSIFREKYYVNQKTNVETNSRKYDVQIININTAAYDEFLKLPGIGPTKAKAIIDYREKIGNFNSIEDIMNVSGIGESTFSKIKDRIKVDEEVKTTEENIIKKININKANLNELETLPGIGPTKAKAIIDYREKSGNFATYEDLLNVNGVGPKTLEKIKPFIEF
jgi:competence protein ComEA